MADHLAARLEEYRKEMQRYIDLTRHRIHAATSTDVSARADRFTQPFEEAAHATAVLFGDPLATALRLAARPIWTHIDGLHSEVGALSTQLMMWEDFGRWLAKRADGRESVLTDQLTEGEQNLAHLRDEVETAIGDGSTKSAIVDRLRKALDATDPEPF